MEGQRRSLIDDSMKEYMRSFMPQYLIMKGIDYTRPFHCLAPENHKRNDQHPSMSYKGAPLFKVRCFSCGENFDIFDLVKRDFSLRSFPECANKISELFNIPLQKPRVIIDGRAVPAAPVPVVEPESKQYQDYDITARIAQAHENAGQTDYFTSRGFSNRIIKEYHLGYWPAGYNDFIKPVNEILTYKCLQQRHYTYIIPIMDDKGIPRNFIARMNQNGTVDEYNPKTLNMKGVQMRFLNERYLTDPSSLQGVKTVFIEEGWADALSIEQAGGKAIALNTTSGVERFLRMCAEHATTLQGITFVAGGDMDKAGQEMNLKLIKGIPEHGVPGLEKLNIRCMPFNVAGRHKDANEYLTADPKGFHEMVAGVIENRLGRFRMDKATRDIER